MSIFLTVDEVRILTGYTRHKAQITALRKMAIPHYVNAAGRPVVATAVIDGIFRTSPKVNGWQPDRLKNN